MKIAVLDGYLVGFGGIDWAPVSRLGEFLYYDMTTQEDDVFCADPCGKDNPLACHPKCIATPHVAWMPTETRQRVVEIASGNIASFLGGKPVNLVNG